MFIPYFCHLKTSSLPRPGPLKFAPYPRVRGVMPLPNFNHGVARDEKGARCGLGARVGLGKRVELIGGKKERAEEGRAGRRLPLSGRWSVSTSRRWSPVDEAADALDAAAPGQMRG